MSGASNYRPSETTTQFCTSSYLAFPFVRGASESLPDRSYVKCILNDDTTFPEVVRPIPTRTCVLVVAAALAGGCGSSGLQDSQCRRASEKIPARAISVEQALDADSQMRRVRGDLVQLGNGVLQLCETLAGSRPARCVGQSLKIHGLRDLTAFEDVHRFRKERWQRGAVIAGRIRDGVLRVEPFCRTQQIAAQFKQSTGETLTLDPFSSNTLIEVLDFASTSQNVPARIRRKYGIFQIPVRTPEAGSRSLLELLDFAPLQPDRRGIRWFSEGRDWVALSAYGDVALIWRAGHTREVDARWRRLDRILRSST